MLRYNEETRCRETFGGGEDFDVAEEEIVDWAVGFHPCPDSLDDLELWVELHLVIHFQGKDL